MKGPTFWEFLMLSTDDLVSLGVPRDRVVARRFEATGHVRPISAQWIKSFGCWGGVLSVDELADKVGVERQVAIDYAKAKGLRFATRHRRVTHAQLAIELWCDRGREPSESCRRFGVFPAERRLLCSVAQVMVDAEEDGFEAVLRWSLSDLDRALTELCVDFNGHTHVRRPRKPAEAA